LADAVVSGAVVEVSVLQVTDVVVDRLVARVWLLLPHPAASAIAIRATASHRKRLLMAPRVEVGAGNGYTVSMDASSLAHELEHQQALDQVAVPLAQAVEQAIPPGPTRSLLEGTWLGHPLHPLLTDIPIGFWTSAFVFDVLPFRGSGRAARTMTGLGVLTAAPTALSGLADYTGLRARGRRVGVVHAAANATATVLYAASYLNRRRGRTLRGVAYGLLGATAATVGGYLGGHLVYSLEDGDDDLDAGLLSGNHDGEQVVDQAGDGRPREGRFGEQQRRDPVGGRP
jgi:uncharacterized membrane protein